MITIDRAVLITGAGSGIGYAAATALIRNGFRVSEAAILSEQFATNLTPLVFDVCNEAAVQLAARQVATELPSNNLHAVLNIAGVITNGPLADLNADTFAHVLAVNVVGMHNVARAFLPLLGKGSRIINMNSASGSRTMPFTGAYWASKFGVEALTTAMRLEYATLGVKVSVVAPGMVATPMAKQILAELAKVPSLPLYIEPLRRFREKSARVAENGVPMQEVVDVIVSAVTADKPVRRYDLHQNYMRDVILLRVLPTSTRDVAIRRVLGLRADRGTAPPPNRKYPARTLARPTSGREQRTHTTFFGRRP